MLVFTEENIERIRSRYSHYPSHRKPYIYHVATHPEYENLRSKIESWVALLPPDRDNDDRRRKVIKNLLSEGYLDTYNELWVGDALRELGYSIEYEKQIPGIREKSTPDWYVGARQNIPAFYVEVFTPNRAEQKQEDENKWGDLKKRLEKLPLNVGLTISVNDQCAAPDPHQSKMIAEIVRKWLSDLNPQEGESIRLDCCTLDEVHSPYAFHFRSKIIEIEISQRDQIETGQGWCIGPYNFEKVESKRLKHNIKVKTKHYKEYLEQAKIPLVIVAVPHPESLLGHESFDDAVLGDDITIVTTRPDGTKQVKDTRLQNGLFTSDWTGVSALNAVVWFSERTAYRGPSIPPLHKPIRVHFNPKATLKLPNQALDFSKLEF